MFFGSFFLTCGELLASALLPSFILHLIFTLGFLMARDTADKFVKASLTQSEDFVARVFDTAKITVSRLFPRPIWC